MSSGQAIEFFGGHDRKYRAARAHGKHRPALDLHHLSPLDEIVETGKVPARRLLDKYHGEWGGDVSRVYKYSF